MIEVVDDVIEVDVTEEVIEIVIGEGVIPPEWGTITGDLANQRDLKAVLDEKPDGDDLGDLAWKDQADWDTDIDNIPSAFPPAAHDHDGRYYTEAEVDTALNLKAPKASPTFTGTPKAPTAAATVNNTQIATTAFVQRGLAGKSDSDHTHDDRYYTEAEVDTALAGKQDVLTFDNVPAAGSSNPVTSDGIKSALDGKAAVIVCDASGDPAEFSDGAPAPVVDLTAGIVPIQDLHGYDHPWPGGAGKNLWNPVNVIVGGVSTNTISSTATFRTVFFAVEEGKTYTMSKVVSNRFRYGYTKVLPTNGTAVFDGNNSSQDGNVSITVAVPTWQGYLYIACCVGTYADEDDFLPIFASFQAEEGSSATSYEPYANICPISGWTGCGLSVNGSPVSVSLPSATGTVYGGSLDVTAGVLTVDRVAEVFDGSDDENWTKYSDSTTHYYIDVQNLPDKSKCNWGEGSTNIYPWATNASGSAIKVARFQNLQPQSYVFYCVGTGIESLAEFKAFLNNTPLQVCYKIAAPLTYQLTPVEVTTLLGQNTISADMGPVTLRYRADTKLYIDGKFAELQALILEN